MCNISRAYYGRIERGEHSITLDRCALIAQALSVHISDLFVDLPD
ncbi:MAG: helix-turn-helix transcriptional regulator [Lachnospiraceae bacterium]|nr:helix-turn-helix transcriptional regulator [Lachnospiraceae bacterium]